MAHPLGEPNMRRRRSPHRGLNRALTHHLSFSEERRLVSTYRTYRASHIVVRGARRVFLLALAAFAQSFVSLIFPFTPLFRDHRIASGLLVGSAFMLIFLVQPILEKSIDDLQKLIDIAVARAGQETLYP